VRLSRCRELSILSIVFAAAAALLRYAGDDQVIRGDALYYAGRLGSESFLRGVFHSPADKYLIARFAEHE
jgi:hypothetical protein